MHRLNVQVLYLAIANTQLIGGCSVKIVSVTSSAGRSRRRIARMPHFCTGFTRTGLAAWPRF